MSALRRRLTVTLLGAIAAVSLAAMLLVYRNARQEIDEMYDYELRAVALSLDPSAAASGHVTGRMPDDEVAVQVRSPAGTLLYDSDPDLGVPAAPAAGYATLQNRWRSYARDAGGNMIQVAQSLETRRELALEESLRLLLPLLLALPALGLAIWLLVWFSLRPVGRLGAALAARTEDALEPVASSSLPAELIPLVAGFNRLLERLGAAFAAQRALVADAAHELRTPLAAVQLQAQALQRVTDPGEQAAALHALRGGVERATRLVQQLLSLARQEQTAAARPLRPLRLDLLLREVLAELTPQAHAKGLELSLHADTAVEVPGDTEGLRVLAGNLVDNALRYTPAPGTVEVRLERAGGEALLSVGDSGPGIPPEQREQVLNRFVRLPGAPGEGSGLGLAIANAVVQRHRGCLALGAAPGGGLLVEVRLPAA